MLLPSTCMSFALLVLLGLSCACALPTGQSQRCTARVACPHPTSASALALAPWSQAEACSRVEAVTTELLACRALPAATPLAEVAAMYAALRARCREEYIMYGLAGAALAQALPKFQVGRGRGKRCAGRDAWLAGRPTPPHPRRAVLRLCDLGGRGGGGCRIYVMKAHA